MKNKAISMSMKKRWLEHREEMISYCIKGGKAPHKEHIWSEEAKKNHKGSLGKHWKLQRPLSQIKLQACSKGGKIGSQARKQKYPNYFSEQGLESKGITYAIYHNSIGQIVLDPQVTIPASELWLFENKDALALVQRGLSDAAKGKVSKKDDFQLEKR